MSLAILMRLKELEKRVAELEAKLAEFEKEPQQEKPKREKRLAN